GWKVKDFKGMIFEEIEVKFAAVWKLVEDFIPMGSKEEAKRLKRKGLNLKEDLNQLWVLVNEYLSIRPASSDKEMELWVELKGLYEPDPEDQLWAQTQNYMHAPIEWKLYDLSGVHHVTTKDKEISMLVEKDSPLRKGLALVMICYKLQGRIVGNKMHKAFPLLVRKFPLPEGTSHCLKKNATARRKVLPLPEVCTAIIVKEKLNFLAVLGSWAGISSKVGLLNIYAPQASSLKDQLWNSLDSIINMYDVIWVLFGDFNVVRHVDERVGEFYGVDGGFSSPVRSFGVGGTWCDVSKKLRILKVLTPLSLILLGSKLAVAPTLCFGRIRGDVSGSFKVKTFTKYMECFMLNDSMLGEHHIWNSWIPRKVNICTWRASLNRLPTRSNLVSRGVSLPSSCCIFCNVEVESLTIVLFVALGFSLFGGRYEAGGISTHLWLSPSFLLVISLWAMSGVSTVQGSDRSGQDRTGLKTELVQNAESMTGLKLSGDDMKNNEVNDDGFEKKDHDVLVIDKDQDTHMMNPKIYDFLNQFVTHVLDQMKDHEHASDASKKDDEDHDEQNLLKKAETTDENEISRTGLSNSVSKTEVSELDARVVEMNNYDQEQSEDDDLLKKDAVCLDHALYVPVLELNDPVKDEHIKTDKDVMLFMN
nr:hypothetical protein [Tanacetum cinerariifolium]